MDYTKYDFTAIIGAEVTIVTHEGYEHVGQLVSTQLSPSDVEQLIIYLPEEDGCILINADYVNNLTARIKVEDMSVKQLKRFIKPRRCCSEAMLIAEDGVHHSLLDSYGELSYDYDEFDKSFADYIDCTDWGWKE